MREPRAAGPRGIGAAWTVDGSPLTTAASRPRSDYDGDGMIEAGELSVVLQGLGQNVTEAEVSDLLSEVVRRFAAAAPPAALSAASSACRTQLGMAPSGFRNFSSS